MLSIAAVLWCACIVFCEPPTEAAIAAAADKLAAEALSKTGAVGFSVAVGRNGKVVLSKGYGLAEVEHDVKANADSMFRMGSITKQFTAAAIMRLVEQEKMGLDDPITKHVPGYNTQGREITVRHLLSHTSGIKSYTDIKRVMADEPEREFTHQEMLDMVQNEPLAFEPGTKSAYSNTGYYLLGMIIEKVSGKDYCAYLKDEFFGPLGMMHTRCDSNTEIIKGRAQGYNVAGEKLVNDRGLAAGTTFSAGGLLASAHDLVVWADALAAGKVVSHASYKVMSTPFKLADGTRGEYGFGLMIDSLDGHASIRHGGNTFGFNSTLARFPDDSVTVAVISNSQPISSERLAKALSRKALGFPEPAAPKAVTLSETEAIRCEGVYTFPEDTSWEVTIIRRDGKLFSQGSGDPEHAMTYLGKGEFLSEMYEKDMRLVFDLAGEKPAPTFIFHDGGVALTFKRK
ncbi:MAG: serine hydrolase domain-containing protein [Phycisphaerae bacterium]